MTINIPTNLQCSGDLENPGHHLVKHDVLGCVLMIISYRFSLFLSVFMFWRSRNSADIPTKLACLSDFEKFRSTSSPGGSWKYDGFREEDDDFGGNDGGW